MTKKVLYWKLMKEIEIAQIMEGKTKDPETALIYRGVRLGLATALSNLENYRKVEKEYKDNVSS